jgi:hypothetical protein
MIEQNVSTVSESLNGAPRSASVATRLELRLRALDRYCPQRKSNLAYSGSNASKAAGSARPPHIRVVFQTDKLTRTGSGQLGAHLILPAYIPHCEAYVLVLDSFHVEACT